jgi:DNA repair protein RadC
MNLSKRQLRSKLSKKPHTGKLPVNTKSGYPSVAEEPTVYCIDNLTEDEIVAKALSIVTNKVTKGPVIESPRITKDYLRLRYSDLEHELFGVIWLDNQHKVIDIEELFRGTIDGATVHPREVVKSALIVNASACILFHNHPSGVEEPSQADDLITKRLKQALALVDTRVLDHLIISPSSVESMAERGLL